MYDSALQNAAVESKVVVVTHRHALPQESKVASLVTALALMMGIGLRIWRPDLAQTNFDESNVASLVAAWTQQGAFPLAGTVSSYGFRAGQGWPWFAALGLLWTSDPYALIAVGTAAGLAGFVACWWVARRWLGPWGAAAAALVNGSMFYCVVLDRGAWLPVFLQAPLVLCLDALLLLAVRRRPWAIVAACGWLGLLVSLHYTTVAFVLLLPFAAWPARTALRPLHLATAVLAGLVPLAPFFVFEVNPTVHFQDLSQLLSMSSGSTSVDLDTVFATINVASTRGAAGLGGHASSELATALGRWTSLSILGPLLAGLGILVAFVRLPGRPTLWLMGAWTLIPIVAYLRHGAPVIFHYMYIEFPGLALAVGALAAWVASTRRKVLQIAFSAAIATYAATSALSVLVLLTQLDRLDMSAGYGTPVGFSRGAGLVARSMLPASGQVLIGDDPHDGEVLRFAVGYDISSRTFDDCREVPFVPEAVYLLASEQTPGANALDAAGATLMARLPRPGGDAYRIYSAPPAADAMAGVNIRPDRENPICQDRQAWKT